MKIVQIFHREKIEYDQFVAINEKHKKAWLKTVWFNSIFFSVAEISSSVTIGLLFVWRFKCHFWREFPRNHFLIYPNVSNAVQTFKANS